MREQVRVTALPIDPGVILASVRDKTAGGVVVFVGTVRRRTEGREVLGLEYEAYKPMAEKKMLEVARRAKETWSVKKVSIVHRYGKLKVGEVSVVVAVSAEHRAEAFEACRYAIDMVKSSIPLWKKEKFRRGESWVKGTPIRH